MEYGNGKLISKNCQKGIYNFKKYGIIKIEIGSHKNVVAIKEYFIDTFSNGQAENVSFYCLLITTAKAIIKANAKMVVKIQAVKSNIIICSIVCSIISTTSLS